MSAAAWGRRRGLCADEAIVVFIINHDYEWTKDGCDPNSIENLVFDVQSPDWFTPADVFELDWQGAKDVSHSFADHKISVTADRTEAVKVIVIAADAELRRRLEAERKARIEQAGAQEGDR